jgi:hypothetical protein
VLGDIVNTPVVVVEYPARYILTSVIFEGLLPLLAILQVGSEIPCDQGYLPDEPVPPAVAV